MKINTGFDELYGISFKQMKETKEFNLIFYFQGYNIDILLTDEEKDKLLSKIEIYK